jgi:hypothetical protein
MGELVLFDYPEDGGNKLLQNASNELMINTASYPTRL